MLTIDPAKSFLLVVDFQSRLMPVIHEGTTAVRNAGRLIEAAKLFDIPTAVKRGSAAGQAIRPAKPRRANRAAAKLDIGSPANTASRNTS